MFVLFAPVATIYSYLQYEKSAVRREIKGKMIAGIDLEELVLLKFTKDEANTKLRWEHSKEFEYNGQLYDVVSKEIKGDTIFYNCWWDYEETKLNKKLQKLVANAMDESGNNCDAHLNLHHYLSSFFYTAMLDWHATPFRKSDIVYQNTIHVAIFNALLISPPTPPPKAS